MGGECDAELVHEQDLAVLNPTRELIHARIWQATRTHIMYRD